MLHFAPSRHFIFNHRRKLLPRCVDIHTTEESPFDFYMDALNNKYRVYASMIRIEFAFTTCTFISLVILLCFHFSPVILNVNKQFKLFWTQIKDYT